MKSEFGWLEQSGITLNQWLICDNDDTERWARYINYLIGWAMEHSSTHNEGMSPACYDEWCDWEDTHNEDTYDEWRSTDDKNSDDDEKQNVLKVRNTSAAICSLFENLLDKYDFTVPSEDRTGDPCEARLFGEPYYELEDYVTDFLIGVCETIKNNPNIVINSEEY